MARLLQLVLLLGFLAWIIRSLRRRERLFLIEVKEGSVVVKEGRTSAAFLEDIRDIVDRTAVSRATIAGIQQGDHATLQMTGTLTEETMQRLRNSFYFHYPR